MRSLIESSETYNIYFGGTYKEHWSEDYSLSIAYSQRRSVQARRKNGVWTAVGGDEELCSRLSAADESDILRRYFVSASKAYSASHECIRCGLPLYRLHEILSGETDVLTAAELLRLLMDDCGFSLEDAFTVTARCCTDLVGDENLANLLYPLQPRTAHVISVLREAKNTVAAVYHDGSSAAYRFPNEAIRCGDEIMLRFDVLGRAFEGAEAIIYSDRGHFECPMERDERGFVYRGIPSEHSEAMWYLFRVHFSAQTSYILPDESGYFGRLSTCTGEGFRLTVYEKDFETPDWFKRSIMYQIFPDRFGFSSDGTAERGIEYHRALHQTPELHRALNEEVRYLPRDFEKEYTPDDFYGGTFKGIEAKLPYLKNLGISCIYLNPIVEARSNHRYDTSNYLNIDPILGSVEDFTHLCDTAKEMGIRIITDGVFSHTGADSVYFNRYGNYKSPGACQGERSDYYSWYDFKSFPDDYRCWWGFKDLPEVDERNSEWQNFVVTGSNSVVKTWLRRGSSGWRLDVADELPDDVLSLIRGSAKEENHDALILGEVWEDAVIKTGPEGRRNYALGSSLDSVMNYPLRVNLLDFMHRRISAFALRDFLISQRMNYPLPMYYSLMNLLGSHDVDRIKTALSTDTVIRSLPREEQIKLSFTGEALERAERLERLCAAVQFSIPGVPGIYYGDEQGMEGVCDPFNRRPFEDRGSSLHDYYAELCKLRNENEALKSGKAEFVAVSADVLVILRKSEKNLVLTVINRGAECNFSLDIEGTDRKNIYCEAESSQILILC